MMDMSGFCVFLVGNTYYADYVADILRASGKIEHFELFETIPQTMERIHDVRPDVLVLVDMDTLNLNGDTTFLPICLDIPVICTDVQNTFMKLITTTNVNATSLDLIHIITSVKKTPDAIPSETKERKHDRPILAP